MRAAKRDLISGAFLLLLALGLHLAARAIPAKFPIGVDSGFFPEVVSAALGLFAVVILLQGFRKQRRNGHESADGTEAGRTDTRVSIVRAVTVLALITLYGAGLAVVGFVPATLVFLTVLIRLLTPPEASRPEASRHEGRRLIAAFAVSLATTLVVYAVFTYGFEVLLPSGGIW